MAAIEAMGNILNGPLVFLSPNYVCLDTKMTILSLLEAEKLKNPHFFRHFEKWPPLNPWKTF